MVTATQLTTATTTDSSYHNDDLLQQASQSLACVECEITFDNESAQRQHMKLQWHIYNLKRRLASLSPLSEKVYNTQIHSQLRYEGFEDQHTVQDVASPYQCLFCRQIFSNDDQGLENNLRHMVMDHGFIIPDVDLILDRESFLAYLATSIHEWHECLFCATERNSTAAVQSHMRDKGHCKLNLEREPELLEFWEEKSDTQLSFADIPVAPKQIATRSSRPRRVETHSITTVALRSSTPRLKGQNCRQLARRDEMGLIGVTPQQQQVLVVALKRAQKEEAVGMRASEWSYARKANKQKHDQAHGPLSWAKGGMHNLLPR